MGENATKQDTQFEKFRRSVGMQFGFVMYSGLEEAKAIDHICTSAERLIAALSEWQPIETAPKDGREVLLVVERRAGVAGGILVGHYMPGGHCIEDHPAIDEGWYFWSGSMFDRASKPLFWMPLPDPPTSNV